MLADGNSGVHERKPVPLRRLPQYHCGDRSVRLIFWIGIAMVHMRLALLLFLTSLRLHFLKPPLFQPLTLFVEAASYPCRMPCRGKFGHNPLRRSDAVRSDPTCSRACSRPAGRQTTSSTEVLRRDLRERDRAAPRITRACQLADGAEWQAAAEW